MNNALACCWGRFDAWRYALGIAWVQKRGIKAHRPLRDLWWWFSKHAWNLLQVGSSLGVASWAAVMAKQPGVSAEDVRLIAVLALLGAALFWAVIALVFDDARYGGRTDGKTLTIRTCDVLLLPFETSNDCHKDGLVRCLVRLDEDIYPVLRLAPWEAWVIQGLLTGVNRTHVRRFVLNKHLPKAVNVAKRERF